MTCPQCGAELDTGALSCPGCNRLTHARELEQFAAEARAFESRDPGKAKEIWSRAIPLLPQGTRQRDMIESRIANLDTQLAAAVTQAAGPAGTEVGAGKRMKWLVALGPIGLILWKFKFVVVFALTKAKFLLLGLTKLSTLGSMLAFLGVYWAMWGWKFALGFVLSIYVHEMGHVAELRRFGIAASPPMFIPGLGAFVSLKQLPANVTQDSRVGLAGPIWGFGAAAICLAGGAIGQAPMLTAIGRTAAWLNLFNLIPVWQLDGGRGFRALTRSHRFAALAVILLFWLATGQGMLFLLALGAGYRLFWQKDNAESADWIALAQFACLVAALSFMSER